MNKKIIAFLVLLSAVGTMIYSGSYLMAAEKVYQEGNAVYEDLSSRVKEYTTVDTTAAQENMIDIPAKVYIPDIGINFDILKTISKDAAAWLYCEGTVIDYPVMKADDYAYYLNHLPDGTYNVNGSLFTDYNNAPDFSDPLTVIYGHHMKSGSMFGSLKGYKEQKYFDEHPYMYLYTEQGNYRIDLLYGCLIGAGQWRERAFMYKENLDALLAYAAQNTTFESNAVYSETDKVIAMSTCSYEFEDARYVVIGILRK